MTQFPPAHIRTARSSQEPRGGPRFLFPAVIRPKPTAGGARQFLAAPVRTTIVRGAARMSAAQSSRIGAAHARRTELPDRALQYAFQALSISRRRGAAHR